jgi:sigma-B regulation protein RsbU (phosphoserine phosphatase)
MNNPAPQFGRLEKVFALFVAAYVGALLIPGVSSLQILLQIVTMLLALWVFARYWKHAVGQILWRLRNRLIVAYLLIALVPIVLITALIALGTYMVAGQVSIHLLNAQLDRSTGILHGVTRLLVNAPPHTTAELRAQIPPEVIRLHPGLRIVEVQGNRRLYWPENSRLEPPPGSRPDTDGLVLINGVLHGWAHVQANGRTVTAAFPVTRDFLGDLAPGLGESFIVYADRDGSPHPAGARRDGTQNRIPPALNSVDTVISWFGVTYAPLWEDAAKRERLFIFVRTRPSAVFRAIVPPQFDSPSSIPNVFLFFAVMFFIAELISLWVGVSLTKTITNAVHDLYIGTTKVQSGDFSHRIPIKGKDQLATLGSSFNAMTTNLERLLQVEKDRQRIQSDLEIAREVQNQLYPREIPETAELRITAARSPARVVSGDYYDFQKLGEGDIAIAIGDVAGKGISAALLMATIQAAFRTELRACVEMAAAAGNAGIRKTTSASAVVGQLNRHLHEFTSPEKYATFFFGVYDESNATLTYVNAGHLPPILVRDGVCSRLEVNGMVVGAFPFAEYTESQVQLERGDLLVMFTDGISEPENEYGEMYGEDRLAGFVSRNASVDEAVLVEEILQSVRQWTGSDELQDDMTLVVVRRR